MFITVAGEKKEVKDGLTLPELIAQENVEMPEYVTVSICLLYTSPSPRDTR